MTDEACPPTYDSDPNNRFATLRRPLLTAARATSSDRDFAEDAVQITMEKVYKRFPELGHISDTRLIHYSRKVLHHVIVDEFRKSGRPSITPMPPEDIPDAASSLGIPESFLVLELRAKIYALISDLPERMREVVNLAIVRELPLDQVAGMMDVDVGTVQKYIRTARRRLEKAMVESSEEVSA
ncbi:MULTISPECIES: RNA polymerase sigma factor [Streptomyces]|uniref:RNA polymerase sigma factor n=1 Tax=Streptomyces TaxID=1883 RepID=UPI0013DE6C11|nr:MULTISPECIES: sigma-70 family RNA polymerase sigma factor [Streptomyces]WRY80052.1 sigma-70 family RNA polymerase sigma factor [Streptomyces clavifer]WRY80073.1 sigma-70 family RNA polymerase sigma factor [Streptomyces clavifer]WRY86246.1 sigma-70 family RNA polymerase sigma factor [Streptomyces clavifer]WRY86267.1 sigma-70 family RNA polymerase sigma factor [Streptomyces clavifer]WUC25855.1 sigma-70 family RNA polymerase sigma factor [Streptomyces clavifer]